jgi:thiamine-phosphate pyrophosphorylase
LIKLHTPWLMLVTEPSNSLPKIVSEAISGGITVVQWRQKTAMKSGYNRTYSSLMAVVQEAVPLVVNTLWETSVGLRVSNVHLPENSVPVAVARKAIGPRGLIGKSVHSLEAAIAATEAGADYLLAGTIFESLSHPQEKPEGLGILEAICKSVSVPVLAIGGVTTENLKSCIGAGAAGVAVLSPIMHAKNPGAVAFAYRTALELAWGTRK